MISQRPCLRAIARATADFPLAVAPTTASALEAAALDDRLCVRFSLQPPESWPANGLARLPQLARLLDDEPRLVLHPPWQKCRA